jgi:hypothetical protein
MLSRVRRATLAWVLDVAATAASTRIMFTGHDLNLEGLSAMSSIQILEARAKANLLLRLRDDLDAAEYLPVEERMTARIVLLEEARREYGSTFDDDGVLDALDAADDEWHEPIASDVDAVKQLSTQANQGMRGTS